MDGGERVPLAAVGAKLADARHELTAEVEAATTTACVEVVTSTQVVEVAETQLWKTCGITER